jgi:hypothetical protein
MRDLLAQDVVGRQPDGVEVACLFQPLIERGDRIGGIRPEEAAPKVACSIAGDDRIKDIPPAVGCRWRKDGVSKIPTNRFLWKEFGWGRDSCIK